jgi:hypothetical protein
MPLLTPLTVEPIVPCTRQIDDERKQDKGWWSPGFGNSHCNSSYFTVPAVTHGSSGATARTPSRSPSCRTGSVWPRRAVELAGEAAEGRE